jgi:hypothetical protein
MERTGDKSLVSLYDVLSKCPIGTIVREPDELAKMSYLPGGTYTIVSDVKMIITKEEYSGVVDLKGEDGQIHSIHANAPIFETVNAAPQT